MGAGQAIAIRLKEARHAHINLTVHKRSDGPYELSINSDWQTRRVGPKPTGIKNANDLRHLNLRIQKEIKNIVIPMEYGSWQRDDRQTQYNRFFLLAKAGHRLFSEIFQDSDLKENIQWLLERFGGEQLLIEVDSEDFFVPWELIFPVRPEELPEGQFAYDRFWGFRYIISRTIPSSGFSQSLLREEEIEVDQKPVIGLLTDISLPKVKDREIPFFERLASHGLVELKPMRHLDPGNIRAGLERLVAFLGENLDVVHFACHASYNDEDHLNSYIQLTRDFRVTLNDIHNEVSTPNGPLVVLNACETGAIDSLYSDFFALEIFDWGARGVVATECVVPDTFAAEFSKRLYELWLKENMKRSLGEALIEARKHFLIEVGSSGADVELSPDSNPAGLLYALYGLPDLRLVAKGAEVER